jgi:hypothetical protein
MAATALAPDELVYRAILRKHWIHPDTQEIKAEAFLPRPGKDNDGLSVFRAIYCTPESCAKRFNRCFGVAELKVASVQELGLSVIHPDQDPPEHALIVGLPTSVEDRERWAGLLAKRARLV